MLGKRVGSTEGDSEGDSAGRGGFIIIRVSPAIAIDGAIDGAINGAIDGEGLCCVGGGLIVIITNRVGEVVGFDDGCKVGS